MPTPTEQQTTSIASIEQYAAYPFDTDEIYQQGLASILAGGALTNNSTNEEKEEILRRTRVFYFNKVTGNSITLDEAKVYEQSHQQQTPASQSSEPTSAQPESIATSGQPQNEEPRVLTFVELKELIETGRLDQIPNNKVIPDALNEAPPSRSAAPARKKPWEAATEDQNAPATSTAIDAQEKSG